MSTICKLDPIVRRDRTARHEVVNAPMPPGIPPLHRIEVLAMKVTMREIQRSPYRTGRRKHQLFQAIAKKLRELHP